MLGYRRHRLAAAILIALALPVPGPARADDSAATVLHAFEWKVAWQPSGSLIADESGALYGVTEAGGPHNAGTVYALRPPAPGLKDRRFEILHSFRRGWIDGFGPVNGLSRDPSSGALFGVAAKGGRGGAGVVFRLTPSSGGAGEWTESILYSFADEDDGGIPVGPLLIGDAGTLYGVTQHSSGRSRCDQGCGTIFRLAPAEAGNGEWAETVLYRFTGGPDGAEPAGGLILDGSGALIGVTASGGSKNAGTVYALTPPRSGETEWSKRILHDFTGGADGGTPFGQLALDQSGNLYGAAIQGGDANEGMVFRLSPPKTPSTDWSNAIVHSFGPVGSSHGGWGPVSSVTIGPGGALFGVTSGGKNREGSVYRLEPPPVGAIAWHETTLLDLGCYAEIGCFPRDAPILGLSGALYGVTTAYGGRGGGSLFMIAQSAP